MNGRFNVVLHEPEIPHNTGSVGRLCLGAGARLHLIEPLGFSLEDRYLRRAGLDYWQNVDVQCWRTMEDLRNDTGTGGRFFYLSTKACIDYDDIRYREGDYLVFGSETRGLPESLLAREKESCLRIPVKPEIRSLNLATSVAIVLYEARRQLKQNEIGTLTTNNY